MHYQLVLLPEETLYSFVVRNWTLSATPAARLFLTEFLNSSNYQLNSQLPSYTKNVSDYLERDLKEIVLKHTLYRYFFKFMPQAIKDKALDAMLLGKAQNLYSQLSLLANRIPQSKMMQYCPRCVNNDLLNYGVAFWHICHQIPYIKFCPYHDTELTFVNVARRALILPPQIRCSGCNMVDVSNHNLFFSKLSFECLQSKALPFEYKKLTQCYLRALDFNGLCTDSGQINQEKWFSSMKLFWKNTLHDDLHSSLLNKNENHSFPKSIIYHPFSHYHPIKHLLLIGHLFGSFETFLQCYQEDNNIFQKNDCPVDLLDEREETKRNLIFDLEHGCSLRKAAAAAGVSINYAKSTAIRSGFKVARREKQLFAPEREQITELLKQGLKTQNIAIKMHCSIGAVEQLLTQNPAIKKLRSKLKFLAKREEHREAISGYLKQNKKAIRNDVKLKVGASYIWCYKNDKEWLYENLPAALPRKARYKRR